MKDIVKKLEKNFRGKAVLGEPLARHTSFGIGGGADLWVEPSVAADVELVADVLYGAGIPWAVFGNGTNYLVKDEGFRGAVVCMRNFRKISVSGSTVSAGAGASLAGVLNVSAESGLSGLEFSAGIPGSAGGAAAMNAGGRFGDIKGVLSGAAVFYPGGTRRVEAEALGLEYRRSGIKDQNAVVLEVEFRLSEGEPAAVKRKASEILRRRRETQPLEQRSAGCIFKNPEGASAGELISSAGLSGTRIGGAEVSPLHANYIVNIGGARACEVLALIELVEENILRSYNIKLEREVQIIGG